MTTRAQKIRLGIFLIVSVSILVATMGTLIGLTILNPRDYYYVRFSQTVGGLTAGASVKMKGVQVGQVDSLHISKDGQEVIVKLALKPGTPIREGTEAVINSIGITGMKELELRSGPPNADLVPPNSKESYIESGDSVIQTLTGKAIDIGHKTEKVLNNLLALTEESYRLKVKSILENTDGLTRDVSEIVDTNDKRLNRILRNVDRGAISFQKAATAVADITTDHKAQIKVAIDQVGRAASQLAQVLENFKPQATLNSITRAAQAFHQRVKDPALDRTVRSIQGAADNMATLTGDLKLLIRRRDRQIDSILRDLDHTMHNLKAFSKAIKEQPSLLLRGGARQERYVP